MPVVPPPAEQPSRQKAQLDGEVFIVGATAHSDSEDSMADPYASDHMEAELLQLYEEQGEECGMQERTIDLVAEEEGLTPPHSRERSLSLGTRSVEAARSGDSTHQQAPAGSSS